MKAHRRNRRALGLRRVAVVGAALAVLATAACGGTAAKPADPAGKAAPSDDIHKNMSKHAAPAVFAEDAYLDNASDYIDAFKDTWDAKKTTVKVDLKDDMSFSPKKLTLEAGMPYEIELANSGKLKHEFSASKFFRSAAVRKVENDSSEVKAQFFTAVEVKAGKSVKLFVVPVTPGSFDTRCELKGHEQMVGTITVTGAKPAAPAEVLGSVTAGAWPQTGAKLVEAAADTWDAKVTKVQIEAGEEGGKMFFKPKNLVLKVGVPAQIMLVNSGKTKHEYTSAKFFPTMALGKAEDAFGEYKSPLLTEAEVKVGGKLELFVIPTKVGKFDIVCEIAGHKKLGMFGTITVTR